MNDWRQVEKLLKHHFEADKKCLSVEMLYEYSCVKNGQPPSSSTEVPVAVATKKSTGTATAKLLKKSEERAQLKGLTTEKMSQLAALHQCDDQKCSNFGQYC